MKNVNKLALVLSLAALLSPALKAKSTEDVYLESCRKDAAAPVPVVVVAPTVSDRFAGQTVSFEFVVDTSGKATAITPTSFADGELVAAVAEALKQWQFKPVLSNGAPVATKVVLPIRIVDTTVIGSRFAAN